MKPGCHTISVIIPVYNRPDFLREAVESVISTNYPALEILIIDDGSASETLYTLAGLVSMLGERIKLIQHPDRGNHGPGASRNLGIFEAKGEFVCFLDSDDYVYPHRFLTAARILESDQSVDGVYEWTRTEVHAGGEARAGHVRPMVSFECQDHEDVLKKILFEHKHWSTNAILLRKSILEKTGGFSESLRSCEDLVLWLKLACVAKLIQGSQDPVAVYRLHSKNSASSVDECKSAMNPTLAYLEALRWAKKNSVGVGKQSLLKNALVSKLLFASDACRKSGRPGDAMSVLINVLPCVPSLALKKVFWGNLMYSLGELGGLQFNQS